MSGTAIYALTKGIGKIFAIQIISAVFADSVIREGFGKLSSGPVICFHLMVSFYH